jgi:hypothetical protein
MGQDMVKIESNYFLYSVFEFVKSAAEGSKRCDGELYLTNRKSHMETINLFSFVCDLK